MGINDRVTGKAQILDSQQKRSGMTWNDRVAQYVMKVTLKINKKEYPLDLKGHETLLEVLRDHLSMTGTKTSCQEAECGACTVLINGKAVLSCITLAATLEGDDVTTIEGLAQQEVLHPAQQAFVDCGSVQCGFCIPGMIMSSVALLQENPTPSQEEIKYALDGNICRCAGYPKIFEAVRKAGEKMKVNADGGSESPPKAKLSPRD